MSNGTLQAVIVDDEPLARRNVRSLLKRHPEIEVLAECPNGAQAIALLNHAEIDLLFLDVQMPELSGFDVLEKITCKKMPAIIFITAYDQFAIKAFEVSAIDYLLKPLDGERFEAALSRAISNLRNREMADVEQRLVNLLNARESSTATPTSGEYLKRMVIRSASRVFFLRTEEIDYIEANDYYANIHIAGKQHLIRESIKDLEVQLDPKQFIRIHRSTIVNVDRIKELRNRAAGAYSAVLIDGTELKLSRSRWELVLNSLRVAR